MILPGNRRRGEGSDSRIGRVPYSSTNQLWLVLPIPCFEHKLGQTVSKLAGLAGWPEGETGGSRVITKELS